MESKYYVMHIQLLIGYSKSYTCYFVSHRFHKEGSGYVAPSCQFVILARMIIASVDKEGF